MSTARILARSSASRTVPSSDSRVHSGKLVRTHGNQKRLRRSCRGVVLVEGNSRDLLRRRQNLHPLVDDKTGDFGPGSRRHGSERDQGQIGRGVLRVLTERDPVVARDCGELCHIRARERRGRPEIHYIGWPGAAATRQAGCAPFAASKWSLRAHRRPARDAALQNCGHWAESVGIQSRKYEKRLAEDRLEAGDVVITQRIRVGSGAREARSKSVRVRRHEPFSSANCACRLGSPLRGVE